MTKELLIGAGNSRKKQVTWSGAPTEWGELTTLDIDPATEPTVVWDMNQLPYPFEDNTFDEVHGYQCMEHVGKQGDWKFFFAQFDEFHRILKPGGSFVCTVPMWDSEWAWGDPGHTRVITKGSLIFLDQRQYIQVGSTPITDYRDVYSGDFETMSVIEDEHTFGFILKCIKAGAIHAPHATKK